MTKANPVSAAAGGGDVLPQNDSSTPEGPGISKVLVYDTICSVYKKSKYKGLFEGEKGPSEEEIVFDPPISFSWEMIRDAPRNSILGYPVGGQQVKTVVEEGEKKASLRLYYPFFSSHIALPIKPGEHVFTINPDPSSQTQYWMTRVPGSLTTEDVNFTHHDRINIEPGPALPPLEAGSKFRKPSFINGSSIASSNPEEKLSEEAELEQTTLYTIDDRNGYEVIWDNFLNPEFSDAAFFPEPVPRLTKRPGDLVLQGSNNSTIILGSDRGYGVTNRPAPEKSNAEPDGFADQLAGAIDLVVGRGRVFEDADNAKDKAPADENSLTRPRIIENTRASLETDKDSTTDEANKSDSAAAGALSLDSALKQDIENRFMDIPEGDPDFINDAARLYLTMQGDIDNKLGISPGSIPAALAGSLDPDEKSSSASVKADRIRIVARRTGVPSNSPAEHTDTEITSGDIRIIKQGAAGADAASIYLLADGTVQVSGKTINLTRQEDISASEYGSSGPGPGSTQPYVRFSDLKKLFEETFAALEKMADTVLTHVTPGSGAPSPQLLKSATELKADLKAIKTASKDFDEMASVRIFGE